LALECPGGIIASSIVAAGGDGGGSGFFRRPGGFDGEEALESVHFFYFTFTR